VNELAVHFSSVHSVQSQFSAVHFIRSVCTFRDHGFL